MAKKEGMSAPGESEGEQVRRLLKSLERSDAGDSGVVNRIDIAVSRKVHDELKSQAASLEAVARMEASRVEKLEGELAAAPARAELGEKVEKAKRAFTKIGYRVAMLKHFERFPTLERDKFFEELSAASGKQEDREVFDSAFDLVHGYLSGSGLLAE